MIDRYPNYRLPATVDEAVDILLSDLTTQQMSAIGEMTDREFDRLCSELVPHLQHDFRLWAGNDSLLISCFDNVGNTTCTDPMRIVMEAMRSRIQSLDDIIIAVQALSGSATLIDRGPQKRSHAAGHPHPMVGAMVETPSLAQIVVAARKNGKPISVCGEVAHQVDFLPFLLGIGVERLSVDPQFLPVIQI